MSPDSTTTDTLSRAGQHAFGAPTLSGTLRATPQDFRVVEELGFEPSGDGPHAFVLVEKEDLTTLDLIDQVARAARTRPREVGYCGLKDRYAVTRQWLSLPQIRAGEASSWSFDQWRVVDVSRNRRKLKIGAHKRNRFVLRITGLDGSPEDLASRIEAIRERGVPNYFGAQRFGHQGDNLRRARRWFVDGVELKRRQRRFALSAARSWLFNRVLSARVEAGNWATLLPGEPVSLDGSRSFFHPKEDEAESLAERFDALDLHPSGPLWGAGDSEAKADCAAFEADAMTQMDWLADGLAAQGLRQERRALRLQVMDLETTLTDDILELRFALNKGAFATSVVHELVRVNGGQIYA
ncbi:MAG: tRNA pseudouridine(13) synthase TruD [Gammaproteobacteria bacterium]